MQKRYNYCDFEGKFKLNYSFFSEKWRWIIDTRRAPIVNFFATDWPYNINYSTKHHAYEENISLIYFVENI